MVSNNDRLRSETGSQLAAPRRQRLAGHTGDFIQLWTRRFTSQPSLYVPFTEAKQGTFITIYELGRRFFYFECV